MAKYWEDWSGSTLSAAPAGWSLPWGSNFTTFEVQADVDGPAGRRLRCLNAGTKRTAITHDAASADADRVDFKIRALCRLQSSTTVFVLHSGAAGRVAGSSGNETAYVGVFQQNGGGDADRRVASYRYTTGSINSIHISTNDAVWATGTLYWIKLDVVGDQVTVAIAPHGDELNDIYTNTTTNSNITAAGALGLFTFSSSQGNVDFLAVAIATGEDDAFYAEPADSMQATGPIALAGTAALSGIGTLAAAGAVSLTGAADLQSPTTNDIEAAGAIAVTGTADLSATGALAGTGTIAWSAAADLQGQITLLWDLDSANIDPNVFTVDDPETSTPTIHLKARLTTYEAIANSRFVHWHFGLTGLAGKRPIIEIDTTNRHLFSTYAASWRPAWTEDFTAWTQFGAFTPLTTPHRVQFQPDEAFTADTIYFADHPPYRIADFAALAADLAADVSGLVSVSASADAAGVIGTSPAETDDLSRAVGEHAIYGFVLGNDDPTDDGLRKRWMLIDCGVHAGEVLDGWPLRGIVDFYLNGTGTHADRIRANWKIGLYFALTPNGRFGGHMRSNFRVLDGDTKPKDPNRDWVDFELAEAVIVRDAILADMPAVWDVTLSLHTTSDISITETIYRNTSVPDQTTQNAWLDNLDTADGQSWNRVDFGISTSLSGWAASKDCPVVLISEFGTRTASAVSRYQQCGQRYLEATSLTDAAGLFVNATATGSITWTGTAALSAIGALDATGAIVWTDIADLSGMGALVATGATAWTPIADLSATGSLDATGTVSWAGTADLQSPTTNDIAATGAISWAATADLSALGALAASASVTINATADPSATGALAGTGAISWTGAATAHQGAAMTATGAMAFTATATLAEVSGLIARGDILISATALLKATGTLAASAALSWSGTAALTDTAVEITRYPRFSLDRINRIALDRNTQITLRR